MTGFKHGGHGTRLYRIWYGLRMRCLNPTHERDKRNYAGLTYDPEWDDFAVFREWALATGYAEDLTLDRIDRSMGYFPDNCRWATVLEQNRNKVTTHKLIVFGETKTTPEWAEDPRCSVSYRALRWRIKEGWGHEEAVLTPRQSNGSWRQGGQSAVVIQ